MFSRTITSVFCALSLSILATAMPSANGNTGNPTTTTVTVTAPTPTPTSASDCKTGPVQCCNSVTSSSSPAGAAILGLLGIAVQGVDLLLGLTCSPITVIGVGGSSCSSNVVCCENNSFGGLISIGCVPVNLS